jgi:hypothetical protein
MKNFKIYKTKTGKYTLTENETVAGNIKAKTLKIAKNTVKLLNKTFTEDAI